MRLRTKLVLPPVLVALGFAAYVHWGFIPAFLDHNRVQHEHSLNEQLSAIAYGLKVPLLRNDLVLARAALESFWLENRSWAALRLYAPDGKLLYPPPDAAPEPPPQAELLRKEIFYRLQLLGTLEAAVDPAAYLSEHYPFFRSLEALILTMIALSALIAAVALDRLVRRPLTKLGHAAQRLAAGDYAAELPAPGRDAIGCLAASFAGMRHAIHEHQEQIERELRGRARAEEQNRSVYRTQAAIGAILRLTFEPTPLPVLLERALDILFDIPWLHIQSRGCIFLADPASGALVMTAQRGFDATLIRACAQVPIGRCLCGRAAATREVVLVSEIDERHEIRLPGMRPHGHVCVPILSGERPIGVLNLYLAPGQQLATQQIEFLRDVANTLAGVIERVRAEARLAEALTERDNIMTAVPDAIYVLDTDGRLTNWNRRLEEATGYAPEELRGRHALEFIHPDDRARVEIALNKVFLNGYAEVRGWLLRKDGSALPYHWNGALMRDAHGAAVGVTGSGRDISAEIEAEDLAQRLGRIVDQSFHEIYVFDAKTLRFTQVNQGARRNLGYSLEELRTLTPLDLQPELDCDEFEAMVGPLRSGALKQIIFETTHRRKNGSTYPVEVRLQLSSREHPPVFIANVQDIGLRRQAEAALHRSKEQLEALVNERTAELHSQKFALDQHSIVAITDCAGRITYANDKFCEISQYPRDELLGRDHRILNSGHHPKDFFKTMWATIGRGRVWRGEIRNRRKDGGLYWVDTTIVPFLDERGRPYEYVAIRTDISERKAAEEELRRARDAALEAARIKSEFLATMSHEIRTPLNGVIGVLDLTDDWALPAERRELLQAASHSANLLHELLDNVLDFSRLEAGKLRIEHVDFDLHDLLDDVVALLGVQADGKGLHLEAEIGASVPAAVRGDPLRLRQVLTNLVGNSVKFTERGGVTVKVSLGSGVESRESRLRFEVIDTGIGVAFEARARIFEAFTQADGSTTRRFGGSGLGLTIARQLVERMGGEIGVDSAPGQGSVFWFTLPYGCGEDSLPVKQQAGAA